MNGKPSPEEVYIGLRNQALFIKSAQLNPTGSASDPIGIVMDLGFAGGTATLVAFCTGDASVYFCRGGGVLGGIGHEAVRTAAKAFVGASAQHLPLMSVTSSFPLPTENNTTFYVVTGNGVYHKECDTAALESKSDPFSAMYFYGQKTITELRQISERRPQ